MSENEITNLYAELNTDTGRLLVDIDDIIRVFDGFPQPELQEFAKFSVYTLQKLKANALKSLKTGAH